MKFGSVCSGIEAASVSFSSFGIKPSWFSEISEFPSAVLSHHYPDVNNYGDMNNIPNLILDKKIDAPEILCGGTPCQAFSLAGLKEGLTDSRGQLTLKFIEIADAIDYVRTNEGKNKSIILWENVEGVLKDKTNAFGNFIAGLSGLDTPIEVKKWSSSGILYGKQRNVAWRVLDAKYFGLPQQRKRLFVIATDTDVNPELILF
jgi:DNA (cytosine-5)-methyltransferase 1